MASENNHSERREYFRIKNWLIINHQKIDSLESEPELDDVSQSDSPRINLLRQLNRLDNENRAYLGSLTEKNSQLGAYLLNLNKKVELLTQFVVQSLEVEDHELTEVDISGGGLRFTTADQCRLDDLLKLELVLVPECVGITAYGRVVDVKSNDNDRYEVALVFVRLREKDRDAIVKHVFQVQSQQLRHNQNPEEN